MRVCLCAETCDRHYLYQKAGKFALTSEKATKILLLKSAVAAVQSPAGDISYMLKFFRQYVGLQVPTDCVKIVLGPGISPGHMLQVPLHLREDFSGTSLICACWCKADVRRTALGVDIDREALTWGWKHNGQVMLGQPENQMCLVQANVSSCQAEKLTRYFLLATVHSKSKGFAGVARSCYRADCS